MVPWCVERAEGAASDEAGWSLKLWLPSRMWRTMESLWESTTRASRCSEAAASLTSGADTAAIIARNVKRAGARVIRSRSRVRDPLVARDAVPVAADVGDVFH